MLGRSGRCLKYITGMNDGFESWKDKETDHYPDLPQTVL